LEFQRFLASQSMFHATPLEQVAVTRDISDISFQSLRFQTFTSAQQEVKVSMRLRRRLVQWTGIN
jgi:hypothetical protein